jgi:hypothetical protein
MNFGEALVLIKQGLKVRRAGWNGKGMWLCLVGEKEYDLNVWGQGQPKLSPWIGMKTADGNFVPWQPSQTDVLAEDFEQVLEQ